MRVVTQNLWGWYYPLEGRGSGRARPGGPRPAAWSARRSLLAEGLRALDPDLVAFQEVIRHDDYDQVTDLLGPGYEVAHQTRREADGSGVSIASRWPLGEVHELDLQVTPRTAGFLAVALVAEVQAPPPIGPLLFVNHKPNFELALEHERGLQAVICYRDAWEHSHPDDPGHTFTPANPMVAEGTWPLERGRRIDHVLVRCAEHGPSLDITACARLFDRPVEGVWASDHFGSSPTSRWRRPSR